MCPEIIEKKGHKLFRVVGDGAGNREAPGGWSSSPLGGTTGQRQLDEQQRQPCSEFVSLFVSIISLNKLQNRLSLWILISNDRLMGKMERIKKLKSNKSRMCLSDESKCMK